MQGVNGNASAGFVQVLISNGKPKSADEWANEIVDKLLHVADTVPQPLRDQAFAFKSQIFNLIRDNIDLALQQEREWLINKVQ
jgi:hypothetical protein